MDTGRPPAGRQPGPSAPPSNGPTAWRDQRTRQARRFLGPPGWAPLPPEMRRGLHRAAPSHRRHRQVRRQRRQRLLAVTGVVALAVVAVVVAGGYGYAHWRFGQITSIDLPGLTKAPPPGKPQVVLVVGSDSRSQLTRPGDAQKFGTTQDAGGVRSDVIMLVRLDPAAHTAKILSIPRDLLVPIAGTSGRGKINAAFASGPAQLIQTIQTQLGTPINHYLLINFDGFRTIINALGGIRMNFPYPAADAYSGLRITHPGCQQLSGEQALSVARARHYRYFKDGRWQADPLSDLGRIQRQQTFLRVVAQTGIARGLTNPVRANQFIGAVTHDLTKDSALSVADAVGLARQFHSFNPDQLANQTLPVVVANHYQSFGDVLLLKQPDAQRAVASFLGQPPPTTTPAFTPLAPSGLTVRVENATPTAGLAARTTTRLRSLGWTASTAGNTTPTSGTQVRYPTGQQPAAQAIARQLVGPAQLTPDPTLPSGTLLLVLGPGFQGVRQASAPTTSPTRPARSTPPAARMPAPPRDFDPRAC